MKRAHFPGWARPYEFNAQLYQKLGREEEARDSARVALYTPWWTLRSGFKACAELARFPGSGAEVRQILSDVMKSSEGGALPPGISVATKTDAQVRPCCAGCRIFRPESTGTQNKKLGHIWATHRPSAHVLQVFLAYILISASGIFVGIFWPIRGFCLPLCSILSVCKQRLNGLAAADWFCPQAIFPCMQLAVEEAEHLMNTVAAGEASWDSIRSDLAAKYEEGEQKIIADFIRAAS